MAIAKAKKVEIIKAYGANEADTGKTEVQVALLTEDIKNITEHLKQAKKDYSTKRSLYHKTAQRKSLLNYLKELDINRYRDLVKKLNIRG
ncbi:MAG: 30S ribosomal protein S15 [Mycoplasmataceae bacterium]|nr:30S ribosomal protein S15 [Mycoplasmataceae bacterium]